MIQIYIYLIGICDTLKDVLILGGISLGGIIPMLLYAYYDHLNVNNVISKSEQNRLFTRYIKEIVSVCIIAVILGAMIPSPSTIASMYLIPRLTDAKKMKEIDPKYLEILQSLSEKWLEEVKK